MFLFNKNKTNKKEKEINEKLKSSEQGKLRRQDSEENVGGASFVGKSGQAHRTIKGFYVSEKASLGNSFRHYTFKVFPRANKSEIEKEVSSLFNVKVKDVKVLNMSEKRRNIGKHTGFKSGFKKAIVVLEKGYTIGQAKP